MNVLSQTVSTLFSNKRRIYPNRCIRLSLLAKQIKTTELSGKTSEVKVTGKKLQQKIYYNHSDYVGGMKETTLKEKMAKKPEDVIRLAVKGMLPKGPLGRDMITKLYVYAGPDHKQQAQKPEVLEIKY